MSQQSKLASWQQLKAQASQPKVQTVTSIVEEPITPDLTVVDQEILVDLTNLEENTTQVTNDELNIETVKKSNKKGTVNV